MTEAPEAPEAADATAAAPAPADAAAAARARVDLEACAAELKQRFPALFAGPAKPIKLRIQTDIQQRAPGVFTRQALSAFLRRHTGSTSYLIALGKATQRLDLDGQPAGDISAEHHAAAAEELARRKALRREREQALRQAQRPPRDARGRPAPQAAPAGDSAATGDAAATGSAPADASADAPRDRPTRPPRPPRPGQRGPNDGRPDGRGEGRHGSRGEGRGDHGLRPRPPGQPGRRPDGPRPPAQPHPAAAANWAPRVEGPAPRDLPPRPPQPPEDPARRERLMLMRAFDSSPLTKANFCVLKGITVDQLDAQLALARQEAAAWAAAHPQPARAPDRPFERRPDRGPDNRNGPRDPRGGRPGGPARGGAR